MIYVNSFGYYLTWKVVVYTGHPVTLIEYRNQEDMCCIYLIIGSAEEVGGKH
jgi:hypothetical protein